MPRSAEVVATLREAQRDRILGAAITVFARRGMSATMDDVAAGAGVSHGLAYRYFTGKEELIAATVERAIRDGRAGLEAVLREPGTPEGRLAALLTALIESRFERPELYRLLEHVLDSERAPAPLGALIRSQGEELFRRMRGWIIDGQLEGTVLAADPDEMLTAIAALLQGLSRLAVQGETPFDRHRPDPSIFLRMIFPPEAKPREPSGHRSAEQS